MDQNSHFYSWVQCGAIYNDFLPLSESMQERSNTKLDPYVDDIYDVAVIARDSVDRIVSGLKKRARKNPEEAKNYERYPIGECCYIRDEAMRLIRANIRDPKYFGCKVIKSYDKTRDAIHKGVWGIQNDNNFQNAIQIGDYCIDVALDTVDEPFPKVQVKRINESGIENITSFEQWSKIAEKYWEWEVYPNVYFPHLAPIIPAIAIQKDGSIYFCMTQTGLMHKSILSSGNDLNSFSLAYDFIFNSAYSTKRLPEKYDDRLFLAGSNGRNIGSSFSPLLSSEQGGCPLMTQAAFFQRDDTADTHNYYIFADMITKAWNERKITP